jgi:hypothetical protein
MHLLSQEVLALALKLPRPSKVWLHWTKLLSYLPSKHVLQTVLLERLLGSTQNNVVNNGKDCRYADILDCVACSLRTALST